MHALHSIRVTIPCYSGHSADCVLQGSDLLSVMLACGGSVPVFVLSYLLFVSYLSCLFALLLLCLFWYAILTETEAHR